MFHLLLAIIYMAFISLGLPDSLLGAAWPSIYQEINAPVSYAGLVAMIISGGTVISSLMSDRLTSRLGAGKVTAISVAMTSCALLGFSISNSFVLLCIWAIPYGLGAGSVDAALNNYVALHYKSRHMSWLHCMWGIGASTGPFIMGKVLTSGEHWGGGYRIIGIIQVVFTAILFLSLPLWKDVNGGNVEKEAPRKPLTLKRIFRIPGAKAAMVCFFCYCSLEQTAGLWAASYLTLSKGVSAEAAASYASMFYLGITVGRALSGFVTMKLNDNQMVFLGFAVIAVGIAAMLIPGPSAMAIAGLIVIGLGCAPVYPSLIHSTPARFGADQSQAIIGVQMASAYIGTCIMPPLFGALVQLVSARILPIYLLAILALMFFMFIGLGKMRNASAKA